jgi:hypothetical protein
MRNRNLCVLMTILLGLVVLFSKGLWAQSASYDQARSCCASGAAIPVSSCPNEITKAGLPSDSTAKPEGKVHGKIVTPEG